MGCNPLLLTGGIGASGGVAPQKVQWEYER
jgi:hypothetical protein